MSNLLRGELAFLSPGTSCVKQGCDVDDDGDGGDDGGSNTYCIREQLSHSQYLPLLDT